MREKIARAQCAATDGGDFFCETVCPACMRAADAVLDALMEPSEGMIEAGDRTGIDHDCHDGDGGSWHEWTEHDPKEVWQAMIRAAKEGV